MEQLLFLLFILFTIVSTLLERRKRRKQQQEQQQRRAERQQREQQEQQIEVEEEKEVGWPFGGDPFEHELPAPQPVESQAEKHERETLAAEREALAAERRALEVERLALEMAGQVREHRPRQRVSDLVRERMEQEQAMPLEEVMLGKWKLSPTKARDAIIYAEILGPPKAERRENF